MKKSILSFVRGMKSPVTKEKGFLSERLSKMFGKNASEDACLEGHLRAEHIREGQVINVIETPNYIVDDGLAEVAALISTSGTGTKFSDIAIGTDSSATGAAQTVLSGESHRATFADAISANTATFTATYNFTGSFTIQEAGIFNATTAGNMLSRRVFAAVNVESGDSLVITWSITVNRS